MILGRRSSLAPSEDEKRRLSLCLKQGAKPCEAPALKSQSKEINKRAKAEQQIRFKAR
jgi:hypothetical protein